jgi:serine/threonine-protein kinase
LKLPVAGDGLGASAAGHAFVLAGRPSEALPYLRRAAADCSVRSDSFKWVHTELDLGGALEATGDPRGACDAYGEVIGRWGNAVPRSISAEAARDGMKRLRCAR